jgi:hypothetical protein
VPTVGAYPIDGPGGVAALAGDHWSQLSPAPIAGRSGAATVWTGKEMLVWGGTSANEDTVYADGAAYDPDSHTWRKLPPAPLAARFDASYVWTGRQLFVWGGYAKPEGDRFAVYDDGALYDPKTNEWRRIAPSPLSGRHDATVLWTGNQVVVIGGDPAVLTDSDHLYLDAAAYDPRTNEWHRLPAMPTQRSRSVDFLTAVATPTGIDVWLYWRHTVIIASDSSGTTTETSLGVAHLRYDPRTSKWRTSGGQVPTDLGLPLWTGREIIFPAAFPYRGGGSGPPVFNLAGYRLNASGEDLQRLPHGPVDDMRPASVWTGAALISYNSSGGQRGSHIDYPGEAAAWNPATDRWTSLPDAPFATFDYPVHAVWTGRELLEWGLMHPSRSSGPAETAVGLSFGP